MRRHEATGRPLGSRSFERLGVRLLFRFALGVGGRGMLGTSHGSPEAKAASLPPH